MQLLYRIGAAWRNPSVFKRLQFLKKTEQWSAEQLREYQLAACRRFLIFAQDHSPYYRTLFRKNAFEPEDLTDVEQLRLLPSTDKLTLIENNSEIHTNYRFRRVFRCETSGTSGQVLTFSRDEAWDSANRAAVFRGYSWYGVLPWERNAYLWGYNISPKQRFKVRILDALQNRFRMFSYDPEDIQRFAKRMTDAVVLHGYSSMIYNVAKAFNNNPDLPRPRKLKLVKGTSEKILEGYQPEVVRAFGRRMVSEYGAAESGLIAFECPKGNMHIHTEGCHVEEVDGEIIVTNFLSYSFPIIRYQLGDAIELAPGDFCCPCGMAHPVIKGVFGRVGRVVFGKKGQYPSLTFYYVFKNLFFERGISLSYQARQTERGKVTIDIEQASEEHLDAVKEEMRKNFGDDLETTYRFGRTILATGGKRRDFISDLDT